MRNQDIRETIHAFVPFNTPIFVAAFNRPQCFEQIVKVLKEIEPRRLYIALDAPRANVPTDRSNCAQVRSMAESLRGYGEFTLDCAEQNLGCGKRLSSALKSFFSKYECGIVLEDDTVPTNGFFSFCETALEEYSEDHEIAHVCGSRFESADTAPEHSLKTIHPHIWGWATWARSWKLYDYTMTLYHDRKARANARRFVNDDYIWNRWLDSFDRVTHGAVDTWDYQWTFAMWVNQKYSIVPPENYITNIGFGADATHTKSQGLRWLPVAATTLPSKAQVANPHPRNLERDRLVQDLRYGYMPYVRPVKFLLRRIWWKLQAKRPA